MEVSSRLLDFGKKRQCSLSLSLSLLYSETTFDARTRVKAKVSPRAWIFSRTTPLAFSRILISETRYVMRFLERERERERRRATQAAVSALLFSRAAWAESEEEEEDSSSSDESHDELQLVVPRATFKAYAPVGRLAHRGVRWRCAGRARTAQGEDSVLRFTARRASLSALRRALSQGPTVRWRETEAAGLVTTALASASTRAAYEKALCDCRQWCAARGDAACAALRKRDWVLLEVQRLKRFFPFEDIYIFYTFGV